MAIEDKIKWNKKYNENEKLLKRKSPSKKLLKAIEYTKGEKALEIACGTGRNSIYLAQNGFNVDAYDISNIAIDFLNKQNIKNLNTFVEDLENFTPKTNYYDFIVQTNYLDRTIIPNLKVALKKEGILYIETYMDSEINQKQPSNKSFLLQKDELKTFFDKNFEIIEYTEFLNSSDELYKMMVQSIIVRKID